MHLSKFKLKSIGLALFVITFLFTSHVKPLDKFDRADRISDYFAGILSFNENEYDESYKFFRKLDGLETSHPDYSTKYLFSLVNSGNFRDAFNYSKKLERQKVNIFESRLVLGVYYLKQSKLDLAKENFQKASTTITYEQIIEIQQLLKLMGIEYIIAKEESDSQCAYLLSKGMVDYIISDDCDIIVATIAIIMIACDEGTPSWAVMGNVAQTDAGLIASSSRMVSES